MKWTLFADELPEDEDGRILVYTEGVDFHGEQFFDIPVSLMYDVDEDGNMDEVAEHATHWARLPYPNKTGG